MSEVDLAFRRAQAALRRMSYRLTREEWERDEAHRRDCAGPRHCDDPSWHYVAAIADGRVLVDGEPMMAFGSSPPLRD